MPAYKYIFNRMLTTAENVVLGQNVSDFHTGYRAYTRRVLETIPFMKNSDNFVFDTQFLDPDRIFRLPDRLRPGSGALFFRSLIN